MGEALLVKAGIGQKNLSGESTPTNSYAVGSGYYVAPKSGNYYVTCVGGGGSGGAAGGNGYYNNTSVSTDMGKYASGGGGGSGYFNSSTVFLNSGETVEVSIGLGSSSGTGGTTSFGTYLAAEGGKAGSPPYFGGVYSGEIWKYGWYGGNGGTGGVSGKSGSAINNMIAPSGGKLYFNNSGGQSAVSNVNTSWGPIMYGDGGSGGAIGSSGLNTSFIQPTAGNNGICIIRYAD